MNLANEKARKIAAEFSDIAVFEEVVTDEPGILEEWGISDGLFINEREIPVGPPLSDKKLRRLVLKEYKKMKV